VEGTGTMSPVYTDAIVGQTRGEEQSPGHVQVLLTPSLFTESGNRKLSTRRNPGSHLGMAQQVYRHWREPTVDPWRHHEEQTSSTDSGSVETSWRTNIFLVFQFYILFTFTHLTLNSLCTLMCTAGTLWPNLHCTVKGKIPSAGHRGALDTLPVWWECSRNVKVDKVWIRGKTPRNLEKISGL
jgi:hypothetical protein